VLEHNFSENDCYQYLDLIHEVYSLFLQLSEQTGVEKIYKYISEDRFYDIHKEHCLWLTWVRRQDDSEEGKELFSYLKNHCPKHGTIFQKLHDETSDKGIDEDVAFITCFSELRDDSKMWKEKYADYGRGIAIGIPIKKIPETSGLNFLDFSLIKTDHMSLTKTAWDESTPKKSLEPVPLKEMCLAKVLYLSPDAPDEKMNAIVECLNKLPPDPNKELLACIFLPLSHLIKNVNPWEYQKEWRLLYMDSIQNIKENDRLGVFKDGPPYVESRKFLLNDNKMPEEIFYGPKFPKEKVKAFEEKCKPLIQNGYVKIIPPKDEGVS